MHCFSRSTIFVDREHHSVLAMLPDPFPRPHNEKNEKKRSGYARLHEYCNETPELRETTEEAAELYYQADDTSA